MRMFRVTCTKKVVTKNNMNPSLNMCKAVDVASANFQLKLNNNKPSGK